MAAARPPPARPHIGIRPTTTQFSSYSIVDWGEDDAWDSGSDEERSTTAVSSGSSRNAKSSASTSKTTPARVVPRPSSNTSPVSLSSSYTHVNAPNPSSYPPVSNLSDEVTKGKDRAGWTVIRKNRDSEEGRARTIAEDDLESEMIVGEMDTESLHDRQADTLEGSATPSLKVKPIPKIRPEVQKIMNGRRTFFLPVSHTSLIPRSTSYHQYVPSYFKIELSCPYLIWTTSCLPFEICRHSIQCHHPARTISQNEPTTQIRPMPVEKRS